MTLMVFGQTGQVARALASFEGVICLDRRATDLLYPERCAEVINAYQPVTVINAAAYTHVHCAKLDETIATVINGAALTAMEPTCAALEAAFVTISSDYIFDGSGHLPLAPHGAANPLSAHGFSKLKGEQGVHDAFEKYAILQTARALSPFSSNFLKTMLRLSETHGTLSVVDCQVGGLQRAAAVAGTCHRKAQGLISKPGVAGIYYFFGASEVSWACFALETFAQAHKPIMITPITSEEYFTPAKRPLNSQPDCVSLATQFGISRPDWLIRLSNVLNELKVI
mgnify:CR=1 FL=1